MKNAFFPGIIGDAVRSRIRVGIVEDDETLRFFIQTEIQSAPSLRFVGAFESCEQALAGIPRAMPDVLLLDLALPGLDGLAALPGIKQQWPRLKVIIFTSKDELDAILTGFRNGADGYVLKAAPREQLIEAIEDVYRGGAPLSEAVGGEIVKWLQKRSNLLMALSPKEKQILDGREQGQSYKQIAENLGMSINTLKTHIKSILVKTGVESCAQAAYVRRNARY